MSGNIEDNLPDGGKKQPQTALEKYNANRAGRGKPPISEEDWPRRCELLDAYRNAETKPERDWAASELAKMDADPIDRFGSRAGPVPMPAHLRAEMVKMLGKAGL